MNKHLLAFDRIVNIMDELRDMCPWDKKQTMESLRYLTIEETYELSDAILSKDMQEIKKELGDLLLHIVFYSRIASENNDFNITDVINSICDDVLVMKEGNMVETGSTMEVINAPRNPYTLELLKAASA